jgi:hypothetical protein
VGGCITAERGCRAAAATLKEVVKENVFAEEEKVRLQKKIKENGIHIGRCDDGGVNAGSDRCESKEGSKSLNSSPPPKWDNSSEIKKNPTFWPQSPGRSEKKI